MNPIADAERRYPDWTFGPNRYGHGSGTVEVEATCPFGHTTLVDYVSVMAGYVICAACQSKTLRKQDHRIAGLLCYGQWSDVVGPHSIIKETA